MYSSDSPKDEDRPEVLKILLDFSDQIPRAMAPRRLALTIATGELLFYHFGQMDSI
jgi:hypothetical protein